MSKRHHDKRSSFAQSFFESASDDISAITEDYDKNLESVDGAPTFPVPRSRPRTLRSVARRNTADSMSNIVAGAAAEVFDGEDDEGGRSNWYDHGLRQQGGKDETLEAFVTAVDGQLSDNVDSFGDREVLEQYRIMALCEARMRVKDSIGFDKDEYERTHKISKEPTDKRALYGGTTNSKFRLPEPMRPLPESTKLQIEEPPVLPPKPDPKLVQQKCKRVSELLPGSVSRGDDIPPGDHMVRCLGCRCSLQVNQLATLVRCPECNVISPASSTRR